MTYIILFKDTHHYFQGFHNIYNNQIVVFPNPVNTDGTLKFANLPVGSYVHIFTISVEFVNGFEAKTPLVLRTIKNRFG